MIRRVAGSLAVIAGVLISGSASADGREGYYFPPINSEELFARDIAPPGPAGRLRANRAVRLGFVTQITRAQLEAPESPRYVIFAKGAEAEHMIIVALDDEVFRTIYRARALLAQLTANARTTDFFVQNGLETVATWFDLAKLLGFETLVISDGAHWSHRVVLAP